MMITIKVPIPMYMLLSPSARVGSNQGAKPGIARPEDTKGPRML
jgi:hypothetical protein